MENKRNTGKGLPSKFSKTAPRVTKNTKASKASKDSNSKSEDRPYKKPMGARNRKNAQMLYIGNLNYKISEKDLVQIFFCPTLLKFPTLATVLGMKDFTELSHDPTQFLV